MGFTAIWISPVHKNYDGPRTAYGDAYHGYWVTDIGTLNDHFGTAQDLKDLSDEVHRRGMLFMVDVVVNHVASLTTTPTDYSPYYFKNAVRDYCHSVMGKSLIIGCRINTIPTVPSISVIPTRSNSAGWEIQRSL
jgi:glycosidase